MSQRTRGRFRQQPAAAPAAAEAAAPDSATADAPGGVVRALTPRGLNTRAKLLRSAHAVFSETPFVDVRITDITAHARVASGTFYTYFDSKEEIFREVAVRVLEEMSAAPRRAGRSAADAAQDPMRQVEAATRGYFEAVRQNARIARSIEELQMRESGVGEARRATLLIGVRRIARWIERLQQEGRCDAAVDPWRTAQVLHAMNVSVAYDHLVHRSAAEETEELLAATMRIWRSALGLNG
ncbi:MAG TPA: TetR/AcrR family transcriptional regulator [Myxococcota bacterium]|nr:TetR/AcrR family transcriptional regulator [Myxococcota bacterium]